MRLTKTECQIIEHRLEVPDCIADALEHLYSRETIYSEVKKLHQTIRSNELTLETDIEREIIDDCLSGSTFFCGAEDAIATGELSKGQYMAWHKAANSLETKFNTHIPRA